MQRIDEDTYIDDTLVTCAEYQLFIDEMREQGKYYQPDHWNSYQFLAGQAKEPIFGVRYADAETFCEWLTAHGAGEWHYRLPLFEETIYHPMKKNTPSPLGYWTWNNYAETPQFILIDDTNNAAESIKSNLANLVENILTLAKVSETARIANRDFEKDLEIELDLNRTFNIVKEIENDILDLAIPPDLSQNIIIPLSLVQELSVSLNIVCHRELNENYDINMLSPDIIKIIQMIDHAREYVLNQGQKFFRLTVDIELILTVSLLVCVHILTLQERIAGISPAFEGIRLVKERIK